MTFLKFARKVIDKAFSYLGIRLIKTSNFERNSVVQAEDLKFRNFLDLAADSGVTNVYDIGANIGTWSKYVQKLHPNWNFIMFEANSAHAEVLENLGGQHLIAILSSDGKPVNFYAKQETGDSYYREVGASYSREEIVNSDTTTLDDLIELTGIPNPDLIKLDTQGSELDILTGAQKAIQGCKFIIIEIPILEYNFGAPTFSTYISMLNGFGFTPIKLIEEHYSNGKLVQVDIGFARIN